MKPLRHIALIAALVSGAAHDASAQAISNVLIPPQTIVGNLQGSATGAQALRLCDVAVALSQAGYFVSTSAVSCSTAVPPTPGVPGNAVVFGPSPYPNVLADSGGPPILAGGTPSSLILTNATGLPIATGISGLGTGVATWAATPSSANLRAAITDESGTGAAYFQGGDIGTPSAGVATNITALNATQLTTGTVPAARTNGHQNGTATNDNAAAGEVGEFLSHTAGVLSLTTNVPQNGATLPITAGDWDVSCGYTASGSSTPVVSDVWVSMNTTSTTPVNTAGQSFRMRGWNMTDPVLAGAVGPLRVSVAGTTTYYCVVQATFSPGAFTPSALMTARRRR
jgi:hypothetical protein